MFYLCLLLLISSVDIDYPDNPAWWPLGYSAPLRRGYGQWNGGGSTPGAGFHKALDFHGSLWDKVYVPYPGDDFWVIDRYPTADTITETRAEGHVIIGNSENADYGWLYGHIDITHPRLELKLNHMYNRALISVLEEHPLGSHVHFSWLDAGALSPGVPQHGYFNPIDYLIRYWGLFNEAAFGPVDHLGGFGLGGLLFVADEEDELYPIPPQDEVCETVDILVRPYTYFYENPDNNLCIARKVMWRILRQNPSNLEYVTYQTSLLGTWRTLYDFSKYIFDNASSQLLPEYNKIYLLNSTHWQNRLCLTNSCVSARGDASFPGVETVWINPYNHQEDYNAGEYCRGVWDTRLCTTDGGIRANIDEAATFMDGRYAIEVMAFPERLDNKTSMILPVDDITVPGSPVTGVIVNNWAPRLNGIRLQDNPSQVIRWGSYEANVPNNQSEDRFLDYETGVSSWAYIGTGDGYNEYSLALWFSEPVTDLASVVSVNIQLVTGPAPDVNWERTIPLFLDDTSITSVGGVTSAVYHSAGGFNCEQPPGYMGKQIVDLTIGSWLAYDLAGKFLDADASTIAPAFGSGISGNYESVHHLIMEFDQFCGYERSTDGLNSEQESSVRIYGYDDAIHVPDELGSEQDTRGSIIGWYDAIYTPDEHDYADDKFDSIDWIPNEITPTGAWVGANLLHEINGLGMSGLTSCILYGGAWMCKETSADVLHAFIIDYAGNIIMDDVMFNPGTSEIEANIHGGCVSSVSSLGGIREAEQDRYGWIGWGKLTEVPEPTYPYQRNVTLYVNMYDAYTLNGTTPVQVGSGARWFEAGKYYETKVWSIGSIGNDGAVEVHTMEYELGVTTPTGNIITLYPPRTDVSNSITQDNLSSTELSSRGIIEDYFAVFPNPVVSSLSINFMTSEAASSTVHIYDISGHLLNTIVEELPGLQNHNIHWDLKDSNGHIVPSGIYYVSLVSGSVMETKTVIVIH